MVDRAKTRPGNYGWVDADGSVKMRRTRKSSLSPPKWWSETLNVMGCGQQRVGMKKRIYMSAYACFVRVLRPFRVDVFDSLF